MLYHGTMKWRLAFRWAMFCVAVVCFIYFVFFDNDSIWALVMFFASGGLWYWRERRKMTELDGFHTRRDV